jgi:hypothetical protein
VGAPLRNLDIATDPPIGIIPIHFDVPVHYIPYSTFSEAASRTRAVIDDLNRELFDGQLQYEFLVFPPEEGTFLARFGFALLAGCGLVWTFGESNIGRGFIEGLTNHPPEHWAKVAGKYVQDQIAAALKTPDAAPKTATDARVRCQYGTTIITESTKSFLQTDQTDLNRRGITTRRFRDAYDARNGFYQACAADPNVNGIGFDETPEFPIKRKRFAELLVPLPPREEPAEAKRWQVEIVTIYVTSPNWDRADRKRPWKGRDDNGRERLFRIDDQQFWSLVQERKIDPRIIDAVKVQMAFIGPRRLEARVLRVLEYNGHVLGEPLDGNALEAILGSFDKPPKDEDGDLFRK